MDHAAPERGHPWVQARCFHRLPAEIADGQSVGLVDSKGDFLGCGIFDRADPSALWRRYSRADSVPFDANYVSGAVAGALERRSDEACQRVVSSDADYVPGVIVELFGDVVWVSLETTAARAHADLIVEVLNEVVNPVECVIDQGEGPKTASGQGLKGRWVEVDDLLYRIDLLNAKKPRFYLDQREQHALVGSLCEGRTVLDLFSHNGAFALQALRSGASRAVAVDLEENYVKAVGANAQRNGLQLEALAAEASDYLQGVEAGEFEAVVMDPPCGYFGGSSQTKALHRMAFANLPSGGLLATYCRDLSQADFEALVAEAAGEVGREARIFARTSQPFDFPMLLNFPESQTLKGLILQVE
jgi:23S rRNA (cytosine1962-C5)-methyltransferase